MKNDGKEAEHQPRHFSFVKRINLGTANIQIRLLKSVDDKF